MAGPRMPDGATRLYLIVGDPIIQVKSPAGMSSRFAQLGCNALMLPAQVSPVDLATFMAGAKKIRNLDGICVTVPHKLDCAAHCDVLSDRSRLLGAVNVMRRMPDGWHGDMVDGAAFIGAVEAKGGVISGKKVLVIGAGGAGSAIALAVIEAGAASVTIHDQDSVRRDALVQRLAAIAPTKQISAGSPDPTGVDIVANASPAGMKESDPYPIDVDKISPTAFAACVITQPDPSPWLVKAAAKGCRISTGTDMYRAGEDLQLNFFLTGRGFTVAAMSQSDSKSGTDP